MGRVEWPHLLRWGNHVLTNPARNRYERYSTNLKPNLLYEYGNVLHHLIIAFLAERWLGHVHFVDANHELFDPKGVGQQSMLSCLTIARNPSLKFTLCSRDDQ